MFGRRKQAVDENAWSLFEADTDPWTLLHAHSCIFAGRRYAHVILRHHGETVSLLVTTLDGDGAAKATTRPSASTTTSDQLLLASSQIERNEVCYFRTARHGVFLVSSMPQAENLNLARQLAPSVRAHVIRAEV